LQLARFVRTLRSIRATVDEKENAATAAGDRDEILPRLGYEVRNAAMQQKQIGSTDFRIHTWFDHKRNTMVVEVLTAEQLAQREQQQGNSDPR